jgi:hypothetical protein
VPVPIAVAKAEPAEEEPHRPATAIPAGSKSAAEAAVRRRGSTAEQLHCPPWQLLTHHRLRKAAEPDCAAADHRSRAACPAAPLTPIARRGHRGQVGGRAAAHDRTRSPNRIRVAAVRRLRAQDRRTAQHQRAARGCVVQCPARWVRLPVRRARRVPVRRGTLQARRDQARPGRRRRCVLEASPTWTQAAGRDPARGRHSAPQRRHPARRRPGRRRDDRNWPRSRVYARSGRGSGQLTAPLC